MKLFGNRRGTIFLLKWNISKCPDLWSVLRWRVGGGSNWVQDISKHYEPLHYELLHFLKYNNEKEDKSADSASTIL
jgi:hypothetical protein